MRPIGILGGTFDPIHLGHINLALAAYHQLELSQIRFIPVHIPPHRTMPIASADQRKSMLEAALNNYDELTLDCREIERNETSYSIDTLQSLRTELPLTPLCLILGRDAFNKVDTWHRWQDLLDHAHIIVANRPGARPSLSDEARAWLEKHQTDDVNTIRQTQAGSIFCVEIPLLDISSTAIRKAVADKQDVKQWLHPSTINYIEEHQLYQDAT